jgi:hypothetical protein
MTTLNERAQAIRKAAGSALDDQTRDEVVQQAVALAAGLNQSAQRVAGAQQSARALVQLKLASSVPEIAPSDGHVRSLIVRAEKKAAALPEFVQSGLPGELTLAISEYTRSLEDAAKGVWREYAADRAASAGAASELLEKALGSIPRFKQTIESTRNARLQVKVLTARELPTADEISEFQAHLKSLADANDELEREVPAAFRDTLRRCATKTGVSPGELPEGFIDWVHTVGAQGYFKVTLSDL